MSTHVIPRGGLSTWASPDGSQTPVSTASGGLEVTVLETAGDWARVEFANGWTGWVDGRALVEPRAAAGWIAWLPGAGATLVVIGALLPWLTVGGESVSAWDIPVATLFTHDPSDSPKVGLVLLISLIAFVPSLTRKPFPSFVNLSLAGLATYAAMAGALLTQEDPGPRPGIGLAVTFLGGFALTADYLFGRARE